MRCSFEEMDGTNFEKIENLENKLVLKKRREIEQQSERILKNFISVKQGLVLFKNSWGKKPHIKVPIFFEKDSYLNLTFAASTLKPYISLFVLLKQILSQR